MMRGLSCASASWPRPRRSIAPGPRFSITTSAVFASAWNISRPRSDLRLRVTLFLFMFSMQKNVESTPGCSLNPYRACSPVGGSILMTSAPSHASVSAQLGPASNCEQSRTRIPSSAVAIIGLLCGQCAAPPRVDARVLLYGNVGPRSYRLARRLRANNAPMTRLSRRQCCARLATLLCGFAAAPRCPHKRTRAHGGHEPPARGRPPAPPHGAQGGDPTPRLARDAYVGVLHDH